MNERYNYSRGNCLFLSRASWAIYTSLKEESRKQKTNFHQCLDQNWLAEQCRFGFVLFESFRIGDPLFGLKINRKCTASKMFGSMWLQTRTNQTRHGKYAVRFVCSVGHLWRRWRYRIYGTFITDVLGVQKVSFLHLQ